MKRTFLIATLSVALLSTPAIASDVSNKYCETVQKISASIMRNRQAGVSLQKVIEVANLPSNKAISDILKEMIIAAYEKPRFSSEEIQTRMVDDFSTQFMLACIKKLQK